MGSRAALAVWRLLSHAATQRRLDKSELVAKLINQGLRDFKLSIGGGDRPAGGGILPQLARAASVRPGPGVGQTISTGRQVGSDQLAWGGIDEW
jgi:hypothetical protein